MSEFIYAPERPPSNGRYWERRVPKCLYLLNIGNFAPDLCAITLPLFRNYARKIGAHIYLIDERKFPTWPVTFEKFQIYRLAQELRDSDGRHFEYHHYFDIDAMIHPDTMDFSVHLPRNTVMHHGADVASNRWRYTREMVRDGRGIGSCNWFTAAWDLCIDIWRPLEDLSLEEALSHINPTVNELNTVITADHLIDDFTCSHNIAKYGLKFTTAIKLMQESGYAEPGFLWHQYTLTHDEKLKGHEVPVAFQDQNGQRRMRMEHRPGMLEMLELWGIRRPA